MSWRVRRYRPAELREVELGERTLPDCKGCPYYDRIRQRCNSPCDLCIYRWIAGRKVCVGDVLEAAGVELIKGWDARLVSRPDWD